MTNIRRIWQPGRSCFLTHVTRNRAPLLVKHADLLIHALRSRCDRWHCDIVAWVILPDHCHLLLDPHDALVSSLMRSVKLSFSAMLRQRLGRQSGTVWQPRFWDRIMRSEAERQRHIDYIHYNPVKHGHVRDPFAWEYSSLGEFHERGQYPRDWGVIEPDGLTGDHGE